MRQNLRGRKVRNGKLDNRGTLTADPIKVKLRKAEKKSLPLNITGRVKQFAK